MEGCVKKLRGRGIKSFVAQELFADQLRLIAGDHVNEADGIEGVLPVNDQESGGLFVQVKILTQQTPESEWPGSRRGLPGIVPIIAKGLDVADDVSFGGESAFEGGPRSEAAIVIDRTHALTQIDGRLRVRARTKIVARDRHGAREAFETRAIFLSASRKAKGAVREEVAETKAFSGGVREVFNAHPNLAFGRQKAVNGLGLLFGFAGLGGEAKTQEGPEEGAPGGVPQRRFRVWECCHHYRQTTNGAEGRWKSGHYNYIVVVISGVVKKLVGSSPSPQRGERAIRS